MDSSIVIHRDKLVAELDQDVYQAVIKSKPFQRLQEIRFLGAIDYIFRPNGLIPFRRHTRFEHSLGVARLALMYSRLLGLPAREEQPLVIAALLHDIGHPPLSHSLEPVFVEKFGLHHHFVGEEVIEGVSLLGNAISTILKKNNIDRQHVLALLRKDPSVPHVGLFSNPINIDTIEGINRAWTYVSKSMNVPPPERVLLALASRKASDVHILDGFWQLKDIVYRHLIFGPAGLLSDHLSRLYMKERLASFDTADYFRDEKQLQRRHPALFRLLATVPRLYSRIPDWLSHPIPVRKRTFFISEDALLSDLSSLSNRYRQTKYDDTVTFGRNDTLQL